MYVLCKAEQYKFPHFYGVKYGMYERIISVDGIEHMLNLFGSYDENINSLQKEYNITIVNRGDEIKLTFERDGKEHTVTVTLDEVKNED